MDIEGLKKRLRDSAEQWLNEVDTRMEAADALDQLQRELEEAREDAERLNWLGKQCTGASDSERYLPFRIYWGHDKNIRKAIDAAREKP